MTAGANTLLTTPIPARMAHLPRDRRGYPIPANIYVDADNRAHFTINDENTRQRFIAEDRCPICAGRLHRGRWSVGGPLSALHPDGAYMDTPMHHECCTYALRVCPYLAMPSYAKRIDGSTLTDKSVALIDRTIMAERPTLFVAVMHIGQRYNMAPWGVRSIVPNRPYRNVEYWQGGRRLDASEGKMLAEQCLNNFVNSATSS